MNTEQKLSFWKLWPKQKAAVRSAFGFQIFGWRSPKRKEFDRLCAELERSATAYYGCSPDVKSEPKKPREWWVNNWALDQYAGKATDYDTIHVREVLPEA